MKKITSIILAVFIVAASFYGCGKKESSWKSLKIGTEDISGNLNPFYVRSEGDTQISEQIYLPIQIKNSNNKLVKKSGGVSYEYIGDKQVKYIVTIDDNMYFSDGTNVTIDDIIFWYYVIADATYDGPYSDFYLNDIVGLKEYYYDDKNYEDSLISLTSEKSIKKYIQKNYSDGIDVNEISGIKRIDDYTCSILFNSRDINAVSEINAHIVSKAFISKEYVKGSIDKIKSYTTEIPGNGPYCFTEYEKDKLTLTYNKFYENGSQSVKEIEFIDLSAKEKDPYDAVSSGYVDIVTTTATGDGIKSVSSQDFKYFITNKDEYCSLCINAHNVSQEMLRKAILGSCDVTSILDSKFGTYYTKPISPLSIRFEEYPVNVTEPYYNSSVLTAYKMISTEIVTLNAYCVDDENGLNYEILTALKNVLAQGNINLVVNKCNKKELSDSITSGAADLWIETIPDGYTCDKYEYYNHNGSKNHTHISTSEIDTLTTKIKRSTGFTNRSEMIEELMALVMQEAVELPLYQMENVTIYNLKNINADSLENIQKMDSYTYILSTL